MLVTPSTPVPRPVDDEVVRAGDRYRPDLRSLDEDRSARLRELTRSALDGLEPQVVVNRRVDDASMLLAREPDAPFPTIHSEPVRSASLAARRISRWFTERLDGIHGSGPNAGRTVFGSVRFVTAEDARDGARSVLDALARQGATGVRAFGPVSFVVPARDVADRLTVSADDTGATNARPAPVDRLADVLAERLVRATEHTGRVDDLLGMPRPRAVDSLRSWLLSDELADASSYVEAQVRTLYPGEVAGAVIDRARTPPVRRTAVDPGDPPDDAQVARLVDALARSGRPHLVTGARDDAAR